ncbi:MAG: GntR family transcriptional regulator [Anaerosacchariphilus sp.]
MPWILDDTRPIYLQLEDIIKSKIIAGIYKPGQKLPSVRELAAEAAVNPNTMQKALAELERSGLVYTQRTSGRYITEDTAIMQNLKHQLAHDLIYQFLEAMAHLGYTREESIQLLIEESKEDV